MPGCTGIKVDKGLVPLANSNGESWCQGLDGLAERTAEYYKAGARFAKWRAVVSIPAGPTQAALRDAAYGLARYAAIAQVLLFSCCPNHLIAMYWECVNRRHFVHNSTIQKDVMCAITKDPR